MFPEAFHLPADNHRIRIRVCFSIIHIPLLELFEGCTQLGSNAIWKVLDILTVLDWSSCRSE